MLNKSDYLDAVSLAEATAFTSRVVAEATGCHKRLYPVSARAALSASGDLGFDAFAADFVAFLESGRVAAVEESAARHGRRICQQLLDEVALAERAALLPVDEAAGQLAAFASLLDAMTGHRLDAEDRANAQSRRPVETLNAAAGQAEPALTARITAAMASLLDCALAAASAAELQHDGRDRLAVLVSGAVEEWRQERARLLEGLREIDRKLAAELEAELAAVRAAAADLLGVELALPSGDDWLGPDLGFFYTLDEHIDQAELLAARSGAGCRVSSAAASPGSGCWLRRRSSSTASLAGLAATCSTGWQKRPETRRGCPRPVLRYDRAADGRAGARREYSRGGQGARRWRLRACRSARGCAAC